MRKTKRAAQSCDFVFTYNNPEGLLDFESLHPDIRYLIYSEENGDENQTYHFQGYLETWTKKTVTWFNRNEPQLATSRFDIRRATQDQAILYASDPTKPSFRDGPYEYGVKQHPGTRTDISGLKRRIDQGANIQAISNEFFSDYIRYHGGIKSYYEINQPTIQVSPPEVIVFYGPGGTGKSAEAHRLCPQAFDHNGDSKFFLGYEGQRDLIIDDFTGQIEISYFLKLTDRYGVNVRKMYGFTKTSFRTIIITSNILPSLWYPSYPYYPILRRITWIYFFSYDSPPYRFNPEEVCIDCDFPLFSGKTIPPTNLF